MEMGWISPNGNFYPCELSTHYEKAYDIANGYGYDISNEHADTVLLKRGWVQITKSYFDLTYRAYWYNHLTNSQKVFLKPFIEDNTINWSRATLNCWKYEVVD